jgi:acyl carrier protein
MDATRQASVRRLVIDWLDDNYHFGDTETLLAGDDEKSFLMSGLLDSLGFVRLVLHIEQSCGVRINRKDLSPETFDGLRKISTFVASLPDYRDAV